MNCSSGSNPVEAILRIERRSLLIMQRRKKEVALYSGGSNPVEVVLCVEKLSIIIIIQYLYTSISIKIKVKMSSVGLHQRTSGLVVTAAHFESQCRVSGSGSRGRSSDEWRKKKVCIWSRDKTNIGGRGRSKSTCLCFRGDFCCNRIFTLETEASRFFGNYQSPANETAIYLVSGVCLFRITWQYFKIRAWSLPAWRHFR